MIRTVEKGQTLLVDGPASVTLVSGKADVFGSTIAVSLKPYKIVIREGKRLPFFTEEKSEFEVQLAEKAKVEEVAGNTIPPSWAQAADQMLALEQRPFAVMVLGTIDSGKTSFCTYLVNRLVHEKKRVGILDGDIGQSDIGPPCTIGYACVTKPITDLFNLRAQNAFFIGVTSPNGASDRVIQSLCALKHDIIGSSDVDALVINSDGWILGEDAVKYKSRLVDEMNPDLLFCIEIKDELDPLFVLVEKHKKTVIEAPSAIIERSGERRKNLRELGYIKYLRNAKLMSFPIGWLKIENDELLGLTKAHASPRDANKLYDLLGMKPLHFVDRKDRISIIIGRTRWIDAENLRRVEEATGKKVVIIRKGEEEGLLTALYNTKRKFLGIGVLQEVDYIRKTIKFLTPVTEDIAIATLGKVKLDKNMKEVPIFGEIDQSETTAFSNLF